MLRGLAKCLGVVFLSFPVVASAAFFSRSESKLPGVQEEISYRDVSAGASSFEKVMADSAGWVSQRDKPFRATGESTRIWARFDFPPSTDTRRVMLHTGPWESAEYFVVRDGELVDRQRVGTLVPWEERTTRVAMTSAFTHAGFIAIDLPPQAHITVVARLETENRFIRITRLRFSLWDANEVADGVLRDRLFQGVFLGVMLVLVLYNLALFSLNIRELSYIYYVIVLVMSTMLHGIFYGLTLEFLWPNNPAWDFYCLCIVAPVSFWAIVQFVRQYLNTGKHFPGSDVLLKWVGYTGLMLLPVYLLPMAANHPINFYLMLLGSALFSTVAIPLIFGVAILALMKHHPLARLFFAAMLCSGVGAIITFSAWLHFLPEVEWTLSAGQIGTALTGILLSMGLGVRMQQLNRELADQQVEDARLKTDHEREKRELVEEHSRGLEAKVIERTAELVASQEKSDGLLANILPQAIIEELKTKGVSEPRRHDEASILFTDFSGFTQIVSTIPPKRLVQELDEIFRGFDDIIVAHGLEKIKTIGDAYMTAAGLPTAAADHALRCVRAALALARFIETRNQTAAMKWGLRLGVHSGAVVAGIVGKNKYAYDVWGDTVNIASRLESAGEVNKVNISAYTYELVRDRFDCEYRGKLAAKGKGEIDMYFVLREHATA
jgi:class 3 adenylate cyclase